MSDRDLSGSMLGAYRIEALIGSGGMASVYRGFDINLQRSVAIKVLSGRAAAEPGFANRFRQEARMIASLRHPHIVHVYDLGDADGVTYMVQELLPGPTLADRIERATAQGARLDRQEIVTITAHLASALDAAHAAGIIHRDVKPANAMWNAVGSLVLTDFGIAKNTLATVNQTQIGTVLGTPTYLAPEQAQGLPPTPASDIYALGVVLYELISGVVPFTGVTPMQVLLNHIQEPPPPLAPLRPGLPPAVEGVVQRALAKDPAARPHSAGALAQALEQAWATPAVVGAGATPAGVHNQATRVWQPPANAASTAALPTPLPSSAAPPARPQPAAPIARSAQGSSRLLLPILGALLALLLLGGAALALRGARATTADAPGDAAPPAVVQPNEAPGGAATILAPTTAPAAAVETPLVAAVETLPPTAVTPAAPDAFAQLGSLIEAGIAAGKAGKHGEKLREQLGDAQRAQSAGDQKQAANTLRAMQQTLLKGVGKGEIAPDFAQQVLRELELLAASAGSALRVAEGSGNDA